MNFNDIAQCARQALKLLGAFPSRWLLMVILFMVGVESLMFIPNVGFIVKLCAASILEAEFLVQFAAADTGHAPKFWSLLYGFGRPMSAHAALFFYALVPFFAGIVFLVEQHGWTSATFFFGNVTVDKPPNPDAFFVFKIIMYVVSLPLSFVPAAVSLMGQTGFRAIRLGIVASLSNWKAVMITFIASLAEEWLESLLAALLPRSIGTLLTIAMLLLFVAWSFAFSYTLSIRAFNIMPIKKPTKI